MKIDMLQMIMITNLLLASRQFGGFSQSTLALVLFGLSLQLATRLFFALSEQIVLSSRFGGFGAFAFEPLVFFATFCFNRRLAFASLSFDAFDTFDFCNNTKIMQI